jgi:hypothetical protein
MASLSMTRAEGDPTGRAGWTDDRKRSGTRATRTRTNGTTRAHSSVRRSIDLVLHLPPARRWALVVRVQ